MRLSLRLTPAMGRHARLFVVLATNYLAGPCLHADVEIVSKETIAGSDRKTILSIKGDLMRTETEVAPGTNIVTIQHCNTGEIIQISDHTKAYMISRDSSDAADANHDQERTSGEKNGGVISVTIKSRDTGEHKAVLGRDARHVITEIKVEAGPNVCVPGTYIKQDGWYIDFSTPRNCSTEHSLIRMRAMQAGCKDTIRFSDTSNARPGYPVMLTTTMDDGPSTHQETTEISSPELDPELFLIPKGYREVHSLRELAGGNPDAMAGKQQSSGSTARATDPALEWPAKQPGSVRIGIVPVHVNGPGDGNVIREQLLEEAKVRKLDAILLEQEGREEAMTEAQSKQCDFVVFTDLSIKANSVKRRSGRTATEYEVKTDFKAIPVANPSAHIDGTQFFRGGDSQTSITEVLRREVNVVLEGVKQLNK